MAWESVMVDGLDTTKLTPYGATVCNYSDYHDITMSETGTAGYKKYSDIVSSMGQNYKLRQENTYSPGETATYVEVWSDGKFHIDNSILNPYFDRYDGSGRPVFGCAYNIRLYYEDIVIGSAGGGGSYHMANPSATVDDVNAPDCLTFGFIIDTSRQIGQVLGYCHNKFDSPYFWSQNTSTTPTSKYATVYNIVMENILNFSSAQNIQSKGKIIQLSMINTMNHGIRNTGGASSVSLTNASKLSDLIYNSL